MLLPPLTAHDFECAVTTTFGELYNNGLPAQSIKHTIAPAGYVAKGVHPFASKLSLGEVEQTNVLHHSSNARHDKQCTAYGQGASCGPCFSLPLTISSYLTSLGPFLFRSSWQPTTQHNTFTRRGFLHIGLAAKHALTAHTQIQDSNYSHARIVVFKSALRPSPFEDRIAHVLNKFGNFATSIMKCQASPTQEDYTVDMDASHSALHRQEVQYEHVHDSISPSHKSAYGTYDQ